MVGAHEPIVRAQEDVASDVFWTERVGTFYAQFTGTLLAQVAEMPRARPLTWNKKHTAYSMVDIFIFPCSF